MQFKLSRRALLTRSLALGAAAPILSIWSATANAAALPPLDPNDPTAKALGFVNDAKSVDAAANPTFKPIQKCATCAQYQGKASDPVAPCAIFAGKSVPAAGWCKVWAAKPTG
jgi:hypothetical protein